jgi:hypothetical protein
MKQFQIIQIKYDSKKFKNKEESINNLKTSNKLKMIDIHQFMTNNIIKIPHN